MKLNFFNFKQFKDKILLSNDMGQFIFVNQSEFKEIVAKKIEPESELYNSLIEKNIIYEENDAIYSNDSRYALREIKNHVNSATALHIFVVTTACNMSCIYCQANNGKETPNMFMTKEIAKKTIDLALESPETSLDFEFQGGEPLLNFEIIKYMVEYTEENKGSHTIRYNIVTNLTLITDEMLLFFKEHEFGISTSLDGPRELHNQNRKFRAGDGTYDTVVDSIKRIQSKGMHVGAIETTTKFSLDYPEELVQTYAKLGFDNVFIRPLTPLGKATVNWTEIGYTAEEFLVFYKKAVEEVIRINQTGQYMKESHAAILLKRMSGDFVNYMELRSPCGAGIGQLAYYCDGNVFTCDEGRMLYEMGDDTFCLGNVEKNTYSEVINNSVCKTVCSASILESIPSCCDCVYQPYCGICPVVNYAATGDVLEKEPRSYRCKIYTGLLDYLFSKVLEDNTEVINILNSWRN